jgi:hypothetical protein
MCKANFTDPKDPTPIYLMKLNSRIDENKRFVWMCKRISKLYKIVEKIKRKNKLEYSQIKKNHQTQTLIYSFRAP